MDKYKRQIKRIGFPNINGDESCRKCREGETMRMIKEFCGSYHPDWIIVKKGGIETERWNTNYIEFIEWE